MRLTLLGLVVCEVVAELLLVRHAKDDCVSAFLLAIVAYVGVCFLWSRALRRDDGSLTLLNARWQALNIAIVSLFGVLVLKEHVSPSQRVGIALAIVAALLMA